MPCEHDPSSDSGLSTFGRAAGDVIGKFAADRYSFSMHVFTYGTLMFPQIWQAVVGREFVAVEGAATGFAIYRVREAVFPGITAATDADVVRGVVYLDVDEASLARLDRFEDDYYERQALWIACDDGQRRQANAYIVPIHSRVVLTDEVWDRGQFIASGGLDHFIRRFAGFSRIDGSQL
ncbi:MAG: gamma-glutamylcyclotransferase family protein [Pirellulales bacterium]